MKGKSWVKENRQIAFDTYCECDGSIEATRKTLIKKGLELSRQTLYDWEQKYNWKERKAEIDRKRQEVEGQTADEQLLQGLLRQKKKIEEHFESLGTEIDTQAIHGYTNLVKTIIEIRARSNANRAEMFMQFLKDLVEYAQKNDSEALEIIDRNLDDFVQFVREKYGN
jgi:hypothetical protein